MSEAAPAPPSPQTGPKRVRIWDWPTRAFHWLLVLLIAAMWWTGDTDVELHVTLGIVTTGLLLFRLIWGLIGSSTARFSNFLKGPRGVISYLNGSAGHALGHNPLGGWSVALMLAVLTVQVALGLFSEDDDGLAWGPLSTWLDGDTAEWVTEWHQWLFNPILALIALHVAAVLYYAVVSRRNLVGPMITGSGSASDGVEPMGGAPAWRLAVALAIAAGTAFWLWSRI